MPKLAKIIKDKSIESIIEKLLLLLWVLLVPFILWFKDFLSNISQNFSKEFLLIVSLMLLSTSVLLFSRVIRLRKRLKNDLIQAVGVYWDKNLNTYCPSCKKLLSNYAFYLIGSKYVPGFKCISCNDVIHMSDDEKIFLKIEEAREIVKDLFNKG